MGETGRNTMLVTNQSTARMTEERKRHAGLTPKAYQELKSSIHRDLLSRVDLEKLMGLGDGRARSQIFGIIQELVGTSNTPLSGMERERLSREVLDEVFGLGPLEPLLQDPTINDILVNTHKQVYVERAGLLETTNVTFKDDAHLMHIIDKIVSAVGRRVDESSPMVDARLMDGSRVNVIIPPLAIDGPILSIRRFGHIPLEADDLLANRTMTPQMLELLKGAVMARLNILISGGTGAGKTTMLNILSGYISHKERIVTIEDSAELQMKQEHVVRLECRPPNVEGKGAVRQRQLVINSLRMRPDRIIVGEVRGGAGYVAGHEYRPRRLADDDPRQQPSGCGRPIGNHGVDGQPESAREGRSPADCFGGCDYPPGLADERWHAARHSLYGDLRNG